MRWSLRAILLLAPVVWTAGCGRPEAANPAPAPAAAAQGSRIKQAQAKLPTIQLWLGPKELVAEQALTPTQVETGMMFRTEMGEGEGMLFVFGRPHQASFWMRNTLLPLSCAYIDPGGVVLEIRDMKPLDETPIQAATDQVQYVLEVKQGWFDRNQIKPGTIVRTEKGSLSETYFGRP